MLPSSILRFLLTCVVAASPVLTGFAAAEAKPGGNGRYIVVLKESVAQPGRVANEHSRAHSASVSHVYGHALKGYAAVIPNDRVAALRRDSRVAFISEDRLVEASAQILPTGVDRIEADQSTQVSGDRVYPETGRVRTRVAVLDTGSGPHNDLKVLGGTNCSTGSGYEDDNGHGTHVAGIIGAKDNGSGVVGVAPGAAIYSVRVLNRFGSGSWASVICGIDWVSNTTLHPRIPLANLSLGGSGSDDGNCGYTNDDALHRAICGSTAKGTTYVVAAGNKGINIAASTPASYNEVLAVTAMADFNGRPGGGAGASCRSDVDDTAADFSNFATAGSSDEGHTVAAPGVCIRSTWKGGRYNVMSGTSMAAPHAAGSLALCMSAGLCGSRWSSSALISKLRSDAKANSDDSVAAQATDPSVVYYGYQADPHSPFSGGDGPTRYYGYLLYAGGY